jgi:hypothetical protein
VRELLVHDPTNVECRPCLRATKRNRFSFGPILVGVRLEIDANRVMTEQDHF